MTRSIKKGLNVDEKLLKKIAGKNPLETPMVKTWKRACVISPEMLGFTFGVHNGKTHVESSGYRRYGWAQIGRIFSNQKIYEARRKDAERA